MTYLIGLPLLALAAVVQATLLARLDFFGASIDLVMLLTLSWTLAGEWHGGILWGLMGGLCLDLLSGGPLGASALALVLVTYFASLSEGRFWRSHVLLPLGTVLIGTVVFHAASLLALMATGYPINLGASLLRVTLPTMLLNTLAMLPIYHAVRGLRAFVYPAPVSL